VIFGIGIIGILHEIFWSTSDRPTLIILFAAMIGLPAFLRIDERGRGDDDR
jgi:predicted membrane channel-forming protein YqfA (hemolysin III family)